MPEEHNTKTKTGPTAILEALRGLDLDKLEAEAREGLKTGSKTSRGRYTKALNAIRGLKRTGVEPHELMVTSIPVIPPKFRPFAQQGDTLIPGDANTLYKDFIEQNDAFREELGMFGSENAGRGRLDLYDAAKALYGYGDPTKEKSRQKDVRGFLKKLTGRTSKTGYFQSKLVAKPMDSVGRSTIIVNPELSMDEIGIPVDMALTMYAPHIQRRLRQSGMPDSDALKAVRDRTPAAVRALEEEVKTRPVVYSRAPAWWKHNVLSGKVRLTEGDAISISPATTTPLNADFDGDTINVHVPATDEAVKEAFDVLMPSASPYIDRTGDAVVTKLKQEQVLGMHNSALRPSVGTYRFKNEQEALAAVKRGDVPLEADLEIDGFNPKPGMLPKEAGKMMEVAFKNLEQSGEVGERRTKGIVYMPDCEEYRGIIAGDDRKVKAELVQKFVLNQAPGVVYAACDAYVVEE